MAWTSGVVSMVVLLSASARGDRMQRCRRLRDDHCEQLEHQLDDERHVVDDAAVRVDHNDDGSS